MPKDANIASQERFAEGVNSGNFDVFDEVVAPDVVDHDPAPEQGPGPQGFKDMFATMRSAFPDMEVTPEHMTATEDDVALAYTITGTHQGEFLGVEPTGRRTRPGVSRSVASRKAGSPSAGALRISALYSSSSAPNRRRARCSRRA